MADALAQDVIRDWEQRQGERGTWLSHWQRVANYMLPDRADYIVERAPGAKRNQWILDSLPVIAIEQLAAGLHSRLTSSSMPWFVLTPEDDGLAGDDRVRAWLEAASRHLYTIFADPKRNFPTHSHELYLDLASIGTGVMSVTGDLDRGPRFSTRHLKECCLAENDEDGIDQVSRRWKWTAKQAFQKWGAAAGERIIKALADDKDHEKFVFHHRVKPRLKRDSQRADRRHMAWESVYVGEADQVVIDEGGFDSFPYVCPRLAKVSGEIYGRGRGILELPDVQMLNELVKIVLKAAQKVVDPPLMSPDDGFLMPIKTSPGAMNYYRAGVRPTDRVTPIQTGGNIQLGLEMIQALRQQIKDAFYINLLTVPTDATRPGSEGKGVTATFTARQESRDLQMLSPILSRLSCEQNQPLVDRVFDIEWRRSVARRFGPGSPFPSPPQQLAGARLKVVYLNPIALAQRATELSAVDQVVGRQLSLKQLDPATPTVIDAEAIMRLEARDLNAPIEVLKSPERLAQEAQAQAQMAQEQHQAAMAQQGTAAANNLAQAQATAAPLPRAA